MSMQYCNILLLIVLVFDFKNIIVVILRFFIWRLLLEFMFRC